MRLTEMKTRYRTATYKSNLGKLFGSTPPTFGTAIDGCIIFQQYLLCRNIYLIANARLRVSKIRSKFLQSPKV
jgi:hypothetical protein